MWKFSLRNSCDLFVLSDATPEQNDVLDVAHDSWEETSDGFLKSPVIAVVLEGDAYYTSGDVIDYHLVGFEPIVSPYGKQLHKNGVVQLTAGSNLHWICFTPRRGLFSGKPCPICNH
jgi:hypothetical protein